MLKEYGEAKNKISCRCDAMIERKGKRKSKKTNYRAKRLRRPYTIATSVLAPYFNIEGVIPAVKALMDMMRLTCPGHESNMNARG